MSAVEHTQSARFSQTATAGLSAATPSWAVLALRRCAGLRRDAAGRDHAAPTDAGCQSIRIVPLTGEDIRIDIWICHESDLLSMKAPCTCGCLAKQSKSWTARPTR